ncbi:LOW QUALITY PROTEIN: E3 ubiquitin-protein ligase RAD18 [Trematomus bernacchii]|uniref:LOW QUALITY PROTEIN: E3 ubiquitin-protein ligase RAD18 n=1 Tax=Trematomus bernacchii TaxID=40690 RepID=UPI00146F2263|nr:LOW QUALITY PROTEIN: E3 ubiquitin-protein ligase RAD18 [Trematomus bernacchii]
MALHVEADLPPEVACLKNVDALLRCPICFDFLNISMMTKCSHNFCSLCIRKFLCYKMQCPVCNAQATEQDLRTNRLLDELVVNFQAARQQLSKANVDTPPISPKNPASAVKCRTPKQRGQKCNSTVLSNFFQKMPKTSPAKKKRHDASDSQLTQRGKIQTVRTDNANDADLHSANARLPVVVKEEPNDDEEVSSIQNLMSVKREAAGVPHSISTGDAMAHSSSLSKDIKPVIKVECPVCSVSVPQQFINKHLDTCLTSGDRKESTRSSLCNTRRQMTKVVYNLLSTQELKRRLKECHLSMQGPRDQLIKRHQEFVQIYNAQCDSLNPKPAEDIAKDLESNEKIRNQLKAKTKPVMVFTKNQSEKDIDDVHSNYRKRHSSDFSRLIAQVQGHLETTKQTRIKQEVIVEGDDAQKTEAAESINGSVMKAEDEESDEEPPTKRMEWSSSPTHSEVSISSSISDIFGPEAVSNPQDTEGKPGQKRASSTREDDATSSLVSGKRRRKNNDVKYVD